MFSNKQRLSRTAFLHALKKGTRSSHPYFRLIYLPNEERAVSVVISKKVARNAVSRNRIRRRILHALRAIDVFSKLEGHIIIMVNSPIRGCSFNDIETALKETITNMLSKQLSK